MQRKDSDFIHDNYFAWTIMIMQDRIEEMQWKTMECNQHVCAIKDPMFSELELKPVSQRRSPLLTECRSLGHIQQMQGKRTKRRGKEGRKEREGKCL